MNDSESKSSARRACDTLTRQNSEKWFKLMKQWLIGEGVWAVVDPEFIPKITTGITTGSLDSTWGIGLGFGEKDTGPKLDARAQYQLIACIDDDDQELVAELETSREIWKALVNKYKEKLQTTGRQYLQELMNYKKSPDMTIEATYTDITKKSRKVASLQPDMAGLANPKRRFQTLLQSLPSEYDVIRDAIDAQDNPDVDRSIQKLQEKEAQLAAIKAESALLARDQKDNRRQPYRIPQRRSSSSDESPRRSNAKTRKTRGCFLCDGSHRIADCDLLKELRKWAKKQKAKKLISKDKKHKAYNAEDSSSSSSSSDIDIDSDNEEHMEEIAALSKELVSRLPKSVWVADTGASSHMTDDLRLFSGPLKSIKRRTIKVGGGRLYSDQCGSVTMRVKDGESMLTEVLYVPGLGVNLLSARHFTKKGLIGGFNDDSLFMRTKQGIEVLRASAQGGVYIVDKVTSELKEYALLATTTIEPLKALSVPFAMPAIVNSNETLPDADTDSRSETDSQQSESEASVSQPSKKKRDLYQLWHRRSGHMGSAKLRGLHKVTTLRKPIPIVEKRSEPCEVCAVTKMTNAHSRRLAERKTNILELVSIDICGPLPASRLGYEYFLEIVDNHSRRTWVIPLRKRADAPEALNKWKLKVELETGRRLQAVRCDNAKELKSILDPWCASIGIVPQYTVPYNSIQNGVAERGIRTTENQIRAMTQDAELPMEFWPEAGEADAYVRNRVNTGPVVDGNPTSPIEAWTNVKPSIDHLRVWGCKCYSPVDTRSLPEGSRKDKLVNTGRPGVFMGYDENTTTQYKIWAPDRRDIIKHHKVVFLEHKKWGSEPLNLPTITMNALPERRPVGRPRKVVSASAAAPMASASAVVPAASTPVAPPASVEPVAPPASVEPAVPEDKSEARAEVKPMNVEEDDEFNDTSDENDEINELTAESTVQTRAKLASLTKPPRMVQQFLHVAIPKRKRDATDEEERDEHRSKVARAMMALLSEDLVTLDNEEWALTATTGDTDRRFVEKLVIPVPESYQDAIDDPVWGKLWLEAIQAELTALIANGTWDVAVPPKNANIVTSKWVFKAKMHVDGTLDKLKARLVARGFSQVYGVDYTDTFAPTVKFDTLRLFLVVVALEDLECHQVDVNNAFTESFLKEVIYMKPPPGVDLPPGQALLIRRSLYGLKQAARDWHERCVKELLKMGFEQTAADPCMLRHKERNITLLVYVDDVCVAAKSLEHVNWFKNEFKKVFKVKDLGEMKKILGIRITRDRKRRTIRLDQTHYLSEVLDELHMNTDKHERTKIPMNGYDSLRPAGPDDERINPKEYQHKVGKLMYAAIHTRPDIAFALGRLSQYLSDPAVHHGRAMKTLLRYIRSTIDLGIVYGLGLDNSGSPRLKAFSDSDYAADKLNRKSILGYVYMFAGGPISWMSRKQKSVATSTTEAEYMALSTCAKEGLWIAQLLRDLGLTKYLGTELNQVAITQNDKHEACSPVQLLGDNQAANLLVKDAHIHERSKHIDVAYHNVRDLHQKNLIQLDYVPSADMVADGLTKPLPRDKFKGFVKQLGLEGPRAN